FFFQAEDGIRDLIVTGVQTCALPISLVAAGVAQPQVGVDRVLHGRGIGVLGGQPVVDDQRGRLSRGGDGGGQVTVAERRSCHVQIGRASCRERVERWVVGVLVRERDT